MTSNTSGLARASLFIACVCETCGRGSKSGNENAGLAGLYLFDNMSHQCACLLTAQVVSVEDRIERTDMQLLEARQQVAAQQVELEASRAAHEVWRRVYCSCCPSPLQ